MLETSAFTEFLEAHLAKLLDAYAADVARPSAHHKPALKHEPVKFPAPIEPGFRWGECWPLNCCLTREPLGGFVPR